MNDLFHLKLYVLGPEIGPVKIGISLNPQERIRELQTGHPFELHLIAEVALSPHRYEAKQWEDCVHTLLDKDRTRPTGEWFHRSPRVTRFIELISSRLPVGFISKKLMGEFSDLATVRLPFPLPPMLPPLRAI